MKTRDGTGLRADAPGTDPAALLDVDRLARLVANGEVCWPDDVSPQTARLLAARVNTLRRDRLVSLIAKTLAKDLLSTKMEK